MRATTCWTPKVSRATRALMMLELSPLLTAANAPAESTPASSRVCRSKPSPVTCRPAKSGRSRRVRSPSRPRARRTPAMLVARAPTAARTGREATPGSSPGAAAAGDVTPRGGTRPSVTASVARAPYHRRRATPVRPRTPPQTARPRTRRAQRPPGRVAAAQALRAPHLRQRPALLGGLRHPGDPDRPDARRDGVPLPRALAGRGGGLPAGHGRAQLPAGGARLPV